MVVPSVVSKTQYPEAVEMSDPVGRAPRAIERLQPQRDRLRDAHDAFSSACDAKAGTELLAETLPPFRSAFEAHVEFAEGAGGLFEELIEESPTEAAQEVDRLKRDHVVIAGTMDRVDGLLAEGVGLDDERLVEATTELVRLVTQHRRHGAELLHNVYGVDTGAGD
jgi:hypothetical protein